MTVRAVLFDIDGTLVDSNDMHVTVWLQAFAEQGATVGRGAVAAQIGKGGDLLVPALLPDADEATVQAISDAHGRIFKRDWLEQVKPFPQATALVRRAHEAGLKVALASSAKQEELDHYIGLLGVADLVDATVTIDDVETSKPASDIFAAALGKLGLSGSDARAVGDTPYDIESAGKCGVATVALRSGGFTDLALRDAVALYDDAADLLARFDRSPLSPRRDG